MDHVASPVGDPIVWVCRDIIKQLCDHFVGLLSCFGLLGTDSAECCKKLFVYCPSIVDQPANNFLDAFHSVCIQQWAVVNVGDQLFLCSLDNSQICMWRELRLCWFGVVVFDAQCLDVVVHAQAAYP